MRAFVAGLLAMGYFVASLYFLRFWKRSSERLFVFFALSFALLSVHRIGLIVLPSVDSTWLYGVRLLAFVLLLVGILEKNRSAA
jgi:hypothetical protein